MLLSTVGTSLLESMLEDKGEIRAVEGTIRVTEFLMQPHLLNNFEIEKYYQNE